MSNTNSLVGPLFFLLDLAFLDAGLAELAVTFVAALGANGAATGAATCFMATEDLAPSSVSDADFLLAAFLATLFRCEEAGAMAAFSALAMACADSNEARWVGAGGNGMNRGLG